MEPGRRNARACEGGTTTSDRSDRASGLSAPSPISDDPNLPGALGYVTVVFRGDVGSDFRIVGEWVDARDQFPDQPDERNLELSLDVTDAGDLRLTYDGGRGQPFIEPGYRRSSPGQDRGGWGVPAAN